MIDFFLAFIMGAMFGGSLAFFIVAACAIAKHADAGEAP